MTDDRPSILELIQNAERIIAEDAAHAELLRVAQEPWPTDGSLPRAGYLRLDEDTTEWTGEANGIHVRCVTREPGIVLYVRPKLDAGEQGTRPSVQLVDAAGVVYSWAVGAPW